MQLTSLASVATPVTPARDVVRPLMDPKISPLVPDLALDTRIGKGTVASEFDRNIRVRFEGDGKPSTRTIVPETTTTQELLASKAGPAFEEMIRETLAVADTAKGRENLHSITFAPDEHAAKAADFLNTVERVARQSGEPVTFSDSGKPAAERKEAIKFSQSVADYIPSQLAFSAGWNGAGDLLIAPDVSRDLLASVHAYKFKKGDRILDRKPAIRELIVRDDWDTMVHETHHSITPTVRPASETTNTFEESIATIFGKRERGNVERAAGADIDGVAERPKRVPDNAKLGWKSWNREHLPAPPKDLTATAAAHYTDGPKVVRQLLKVAGVDLRTTVGFDKAYDILQGRASNYAPRRLADAIIDELGVQSKYREQIVELVKQSVNHEDGSRHVTDFLESIGALPAK